MKKSWILLSLFPLTAFCQNGADCLFDFTETADEALLHITFDDEELGIVDEFDSESLGIFENRVDEKKESLSWASEERASPLEERENSSEEFDDAFAYELPNQEETSVYRPTFEKVPQSNRHLLFGRPRVVQAKPSDAQKRDLVEKSAAPSRVSKKEERRRAEPKAVAKKEQLDKKVARRPVSKIQTN